MSAAPLSERGRTLWCVQRSAQVFFYRPIKPGEERMVRVSYFPLGQDGFAEGELFGAPVGVRHGPALLADQYTSPDDAILAAINAAMAQVGGA
jgi:hypothetical protein